MNIVLIGYRGAGKTAVGERLGDMLNRKVVGMDKLIVKKVGMPITKIVEKYGWDRFRNIEAGVARDVSKLDNCIIDTGGGIVLREENVKNLRKNSVLVWLKCDAKTIVERIKGDKNRPSLTGKKSFIEEVEKVLQQRVEQYNKSADYAIDTSKLSVDEVAKKIIGMIKLQVEGK